MNLSNETIEMAKADISKIDTVIKSGDNQRCLDMHRKLDGRYQACIQKWFSGLSGANPDQTYINYSRLEGRPDRVISNLKMMREKIHSYCLGMNFIDITDNNKTVVNVNNNNSYNPNITFNNAKDTIDQMQGLTYDETEEIKKKIDELEQILNERTPKKQKWEKAKKILSFALDKGADVAITIMGIIIQNKFFK